MPSTECHETVRVGLPLPSNPLPEISRQEPQIDSDISTVTTTQTQAAANEEDIKLDVPEKYFRIPRSQSHLKKLVRAMVTRNICSRQDKDTVIRILSEGRGSQMTLDDLGLVDSNAKTRSFILCRIQWRSHSVHKKQSNNKSKKQKDKVAKVQTVLDK